MRHSSETYALLAEIVATRSSAEWQRDLDEAQVPVMAVNTLEMLLRARPMNRSRAPARRGEPPAGRRAGTRARSPATPSRAAPQSVGRIVAMLEAVADARDGLALAELARITASPKTSLVGLLAGLVHERCLQRDKAGRSGSGRAILAHFEPQRLKRYLQSTRRRKFTAATITSASRLSAELERVRREGIARSDGERVTGASALAVPVFASNGSLAGALLVGRPGRPMRADARANERALRAAGAECTRLLGGTARSALPKDRA